MVSGAVTLVVKMRFLKCQDAVLHKWLQVHSNGWPHFDHGDSAAKGTLTKRTSFHRPPNIPTTVHQCWTTECIYRGLGMLIGCGLKSEWVFKFWSLLMFWWILFSCHLTSKIQTWILMVYFVLQQVTKVWQCFLVRCNSKQALFYTVHQYKQPLIHWTLAKNYFLPVFITV